MNKFGKIGLTLLIIGGTIVLVALLVVFKPKAEKTDPPAIIPTVTALTLNTETIDVTVSSQGVVEPITQTMAAAEVAGRIIEVSPVFEPGESFKKGDVLLQIDPADYEAALAQAQANLADAKLALATENARAEQAKRDWKKLGSNKTPGDLVLRIPHLASAEARVTAAQAAVAKSSQDLERTKLHAPYNGRIRSTSTDLGSYAVPGTPLAELYATDTLEVRLPISLDDYAFVNVGNTKPTVELRTTVAGNLYEWNARVVRTEGQVDRASRSVYLVAHIDTAELGEKYPGVAVDLLAPGLFVKAGIQGKTLNNIFRIPRKAFYTPDTVVVIDHQDRLAFRKVKVLRADGKELLVSDGVAAGERVCTTALDTVIEGMEVEIATPTGTTPPPKPLDLTKSAQP